LFWIFAPKLLTIGSPNKQASPMEITLAPSHRKEVTHIIPEPTVNPSLPRKVLPKRAREKEILSKQKPIAQTPQSSEFVIPKQEEPKKPINKEMTKEPQNQTPIVPLPGEDMQAYIARQKAAKLTAQGASKKDIDEVFANNNLQSEGAKRDAKIKENLNLDGSNGIFEIREKHQHTAEFSFKGWKNNINNAKLEIIQVQVPDGGNIERAIIKKMIEIIRRDYNGDFNWDSRRLNRVIVLSAKPEDNEGLESFLMNEFFGTGTLSN
jgi:hypothetical protein